MLNVIICDDINAELVNFTKIIENVIIIENYDMKVQLATNNPYDVLSYIEKSKTTGVYFLDVDLKCELNGIELAEKIRQFDPRGYIIIVTAYPDTMPLIFKHKIEAMDFIKKSDYFDIRNRIEECVKNAYQKHVSHSTVNQKVLSIKLKDQIITVEYDKIISIETSLHDEHKLILHTENMRQEFHGYLKNILDRLDDRFIRISQSYIVNIDYVKNLNIPKRNILMNNGQIFHIPARNMMAIKKRMIGTNS